MYGTQPPGPYPYGWTPPVPEFPAAHLGKRFAAYLIDTLGRALCVAAVILAGLALSFALDLRDRSGHSPLVVIVVGSLLILLYSVLVLYDGVQMALWGGRTAGKRLMRLRVASIETPHLPIAAGHAFKRALVHPFGLTVLSTLLTPLGVFSLYGGFVYLDYLWPLWDRPLRRTLHDRAAGTVVVADVPFYPDPEHPGQYYLGHPGQVVPLFQLPYEPVAHPRHPAGGPVTWERPPF